MITAERLREVVDYNPVSGRFTARVSRGRAHAGSTLGKKGYEGHLRIMIDGLYYQASHLAFLWMTGELPVAPVRHWDRDLTNNQWDNLYQASHGMRLHTRPGAYGYKGVTADKDKWRAKYKIDGKYKTLGKFDTPAEAHDAIVAFIKNLA